MRKEIIAIIIVVLAIAAGILILIFLNDFNGSRQNSPSLSPSPSPGLNLGENLTGLPLKIADGFSISIFAQNLKDARDMAFDSMGNLWVSRPDEGVITLIEIENGRAARQNDVLRNLNKPHGLAFDPDTPNLLYFAEENKISKIPLYSDAPPQKLVDLPSGGRHITRSLIFGADKRLYVSIGSSCDVCVESDKRRGTIYSMNPDGSDFKEFASGLRNSVFMALNPETEEIWATEMGRDFLGDNLPPDEINIIKSGKNYGWPYCYGQRIVDSRFENTGEQICPATEKARLEIPAHSAPLGLAFSPLNSNWPKEYRNSLFVAYHGSWNRNEPADYKIARFSLNGGEQTDFISGWLGSDGKVYGRPADILIADKGDAYISDDYSGKIYQVRFINQTERTTNSVFFEKQS
ncbi:MAG: L-sorbosone dehydrogenase [Parcubacteria group bacterium GW2011_GWC1_43_12]|nr:MAG: L-sorbosone dehydrogenase [Parcubacteria group bacterium GW2011_GWC1_43_12]